MGRGTRPKSDGEIKDNRRLKLEVQKLKKQVASLRKQLSRVDVEHYANIKEEMEAFGLEEETVDNIYQIEDLKKKWKCIKCKEDYLRLILIDRPDGRFYIRRCPCGHKTRLKKYTDEVEGILE